jgi:spore coat polysaccharide biosynthesis predicted glycosyltransferase SpsG/CMP-N-acetylneuraminic acid synthetase
MKNGLYVLAVVPARGGTDTVPYLNIKKLGDRALLAHTLDAARAAPSIDRLIVSTDDERVVEVARRHGAEAPFLRPPELAADIPSLKPVIAHAVAEAEKTGPRADVVVVLQATTPFRGADAVEEALGRLVAGGFDSVISVTEDRTLNWREEKGALRPLFSREGRRDEQPPLFKENGAVVALRRSVLDGPTRFGERIGHVVLDKRAGFTVHDLDDFWMAERLLKEPRVLFRVDGGRDMGMGHVYRSLAIAEALRASSRADVAFLMKAEHGEAILTVSRAGYPVRVAADEQAETFFEHARDFAPEIVINDLHSPGREAPYLRALSHLGATTVNLVDTPHDLESTDHYEQVIVSVMHEARETPEGFYAGPKYAILREHFHGREKELRERPGMVLLTFGGSDPQQLTVKAARALRGLDPRVEVVAVAGPAFSCREAFEALQAALIDDRRVPLINEAGGHIADLMLEADLVLCSGGMSVYEIAALGTPGLVLGQNMREDARMRAFAAHGTIEYLGLGTDVDEAALLAAARALLDDFPRRRAMSEKGRALVDGLGAMRAAEAVLRGGRRAAALTERSS